MAMTNVLAMNETNQVKFTEPLKACLLPADAGNADFLQQMQRLADESAVRDLTARFSDACNTRNSVAFRGLWMPDAVWEIGKPLPSRAEGVDNIVKMLEGLLDSFEFFVQMTHSGIIRISGENARARWMMQEAARKPESKGFYNNFAFYEDLLTRVEGQWFFTKRQYEYIYLDDSVMRGKSFTPAADLKI